MSDGTRRVARVVRTLRSEYEVPVELYAADDGVVPSDDGVRRLEEAMDDVSIYLDDVKHETVVVTFHDVPEGAS